LARSYSFVKTAKLLLFIVLGVLIANFVIDLVYLVVDPRTRRGMVGESA
jgi:peptide/nickel transport system permease protein